MMPHNSGVTFVVACNCGRKLFTREDPFTVADANYRFYAEAEQDCCGELDRLTFPLHRATAANSRSSLRGLAEGGGEDDLVSAVERMDVSEGRRERKKLAELASSKGEYSKGLLNLRCFISQMFSYTRVNYV